MRYILAAMGLLFALGINPAWGEVPGRTQLEGRLPLTLSDAIGLGLENNLALEVDRFAPALADQDQWLAWSAYDPVFSGNGNYTREDPRLIANRFQPPTGSGQFSRPVRIKGETTTGEAGISALIPWLGANLSIDYAANRNNDDQALRALSPEYTSSLEFGANVPLLRGLVWNEPWTQVQTSGVSSQAALDSFAARVMDTVAEIERAYWNLIASREQLVVARKSHDTSIALLDQVETQYEVGVVSRVEVVEAEAGVAERDLTVIQTENTYRRAQDILIDLVLGSNLTVASTLEIEPLDAPADYTIYAIDLDALADRAFHRRPEIAAAERDIERAELNLRFAKNLRLPQLDFQARYGVNDLEGGKVPAGGGEFPFPESRGTGGDFSDTLKGMFTGRRGSNYTFGAVVSIPIGNTRGRHSVSRAELELRLARTRLLRLRQSIVLEVRDGARNLESAQRGIKAAERRTAASAEQLRAERVRLEHGESTPFDVLQRERDLVDAESQSIGALQLYRNSETELLRSQGTILDSRNIVFEELVSLE
jgi:HAE1 family hydrophobic/amphiphilic exporter-1